MNARRYIKIFTAILIACGIAGYGLFQGKNLIKGMGLTIKSPPDGSTLHEQLIKISGSATNVAFLSLNDRPIFTDEKGNFAENLLLHPGYNAIKLAAKDKFGKIKEKIIEIVYEDK